MPASWFLRALVVVVLVSLAPGLGRAAEPPPRFTEEREAAALFFVRKHCPELLPLLEELRRSNRPAYERQGAPDRLTAIYPDCGHDFPAAAREAAYAWFDRWLASGKGS